MSISTMTSAAVARSSAPTPRVPATAGTGLWQQPPTLATATSSSQLTAALATITAYIPTEILTLYVATRTAIQKPAPADALQDAGHVATTIAKASIDGAEWVAFWVFLAFTPFVVWCVYAAKMKTAGRGVPFYPSKWPWWEIVAATVAYATWAFGLPNSPFSIFVWYSTALAALAVLVVSTLLGLATPLFT